MVNNYGFFVLISIIIFYLAARKQSNNIEIKNGLNWLLGLVIFQIMLGILTVLLHVQIAIALTHQAVALTMFALMLYLSHKLRT